MQVHDEFVVLTAHPDSLVREGTLIKNRTQPLFGAAFDHAGHTIARGRGVTHKIGKIFLRYFDGPQMIFDSDHAITHAFLFRFGEGRFGKGLRGGQAKTQLSKPLYTSYAWGISPDRLR